MNHTRLWIAAAIIAIVLVSGFILSAPHTRDVSNTETLHDTTVSAPSVTLRDVFKKGVHTITGSVNVPNTCATVTAQATLLGDASSTKNILVALATSEDTGVCLQLPSQMDFSTTISAPSYLPITATVNGSIATTTIL